jgi:hypothetical protein
VNDLKAFAIAFRPNWMMDEPRLLGMKIQPQNQRAGKELLCFVPVLVNDGSLDNNVAGGASLPPPVDPLIIDMVEVDVR